jgi:hypothetical protein
LAGSGGCDYGFANVHVRRYLRGWRPGFPPEVSSS